MMLILALLVLLVACGIVGVRLAIRHSRRANSLLARRLDAEARIEVVTAQTLTAMREAARAHFRGRDL